MAECQVKRNKNVITEVLASNGEKSIAYDNLLDLVNKLEDKSILQNKYADWVGKHIQNTTDNKELALGLYKSLYSPQFKDFFGNWEGLAEALSLKDNIKGLYEYIFVENPQESLFEASVQANSSDAEKSGATKAFGPRIIEISQDLYPNSKVGDPYTPVIGETDKNGEPLLTDGLYTNYRGDKVNILTQPVVNGQTTVQSLYQQTDSSQATIPSRASRETIAKIKEFLNRMGVKLESVSNIVVNGQKLNVNGIADPLNKLVQITQGKEDVALSEEAMHIAVEIIQQKEPQLFKQMMNEIGKYNIYQQVLQEYAPIYRTSEDKPDIPKIKKEAIAKVLAETIINQNQDNIEKPEFLAKTQNWWQRIIESLKKWFLRTQMNPFEETAKNITENPNLTSSWATFKSNTEKFLQNNPNAVLASLKIINALQNPKMENIFNRFFNNNKDKFYQELNQLAPKDQVNILRSWVDENNPKTINDLITGLLADLSYTVEINTAKSPLSEMDRKIGLDEDDNISSNYYSNLTVPGGTNYTENEIATPQILPSIIGHAQFSTPNGIGWFRSDDKTELTGNITEGSRRAAEAFDLEPEPDEKIITKTRRILEVQSDLFQKGRDKADLINKQKLDSQDIPGLSGVADIEQYLTGYEYSLEGQDYTQAEITKLVAKKRKELEKPVVNNSNENQFLQLLNKNNNWVTFFVKSIVQDSAKKGYEKVLFPTGNTAAKVEGHQAIADRIITLDRKIKQEEEKSDDEIRKQIARNYIYDIEDGDFNDLPDEGVKKVYQTLNALKHGDYSSISDERVKDVRETELNLLKKERETLKTQGIDKLAPIEAFYELRVKNILDKNYGKDNIKTITDEHGNTWNELNLNQDRDISNIYFQLNGNPSESLADKLIRINQNVAKTEEGYEVNGEPVRKTVEGEIENTDIAKKARRFEERSSAQKKADRQYKQQTEGTIKADINDIFTRLVNETGEIRENELDKVGTSAIDSNDNTFYEILRQNMKDRLNSYPSGTKFFNNLNIYNESSNIAGTIDFLAIAPDGKVDIAQFKAPDIREGQTDIDKLKQSEYNVEIELLRNILERGYGIKKAQFGKTRVIPIKADYSRVIAGDIRSPLSKITGVKIGDVNVKAIDNDLLLPIPSASERTGNRKFDDLISKLRGVLQKTINKFDPETSPLQRNQTISNLFRSIKKLQVQKDATAVLSAARTLIKRQEDRYTHLNKIVGDINPSEATTQEISDIGSQILEDWGETEIYAHIDEAFKGVFNEGTEEQRGFMNDAESVSRAAKNVSDNYLELSIKLRTEKFAAKVNIEDEFTPEKQLTWYRRMVRSLSQSHTTAGKLLWKIVDNINNTFHIQFLQRLADLKEIEKENLKWLGSRNKQELFNKFFSIKDGKWNGNVIRQYSRDFYTELAEAKEKGDRKWVEENIDMDKYTAWFKQEHIKRAEEVKGQIYHEDEEENKRIIFNTLNEFYNTYSPNSKFFVNKNNYRLGDFPKDSNYSDEYKELLKPENKPVLDLYTYYRKLLKESVDTGMIAEHNGWAWFPNVRKNLISPISLIDREDLEFGKLDPITKQPINEVHANYVSDLGKLVKKIDQAGNVSYFKDFSDKSMDIFKVLGLWNREIIRYNLKTEAEGIANILAFTEKHKKSIKTRRNGKILRDEADLPTLDDNNETNYKYLQAHVDAAIYGKNVSNESDITVNVPVRKIAQKINKFAGRTIITEPDKDEITLSGVKTIGFLNRFFLTKTLGLNVLTSLANLFGGTTNTYINQGIFFNKTDVSKAELDVVSHRFWGDEKSKKLAGFLAYLSPYLEDKTIEQTRHLSLSQAVRFFSSDHLFFMQRFSDKWVNQVIAIAFIKNAMIRDGKIQNIRQVARQELGHDKKWAGTYREGVEWENELEKRVQELKNSPEALLNAMKIEKDQVTIPGMDIHNRANPPKTITEFRSQVLEFIKDALGNTSREDLSLYKTQVLLQSFAMFKNWIPRMVDVRGQSLRYNVGSNQYEWGRVRMLGNAVMHMGLSSVKGLHKTLIGNDENIVEAGKKAYIKKREEAEREEESFDISEGEFVDMYVKGVSAQFKELGLAIALIGIVIAARLNAPDEDEDPTLKGTYKWMLRGLDKLQDEVSFFYNPQSFTDILNGSIFPAANLALDAERFLSSLVAKGFYSYVLGDELRAQKQHPTKYVFRMMPVTKELLNYIAVFDNDLAKKYDLRVSSRNGSSR
jgi:hypothetical protein